MNYMKIDKTSISNGIGVRVVLWCAGCTQKCPGCFNPETWDFSAGKLFDESAKSYLFEQLRKSYIQGITFSGGHPLEICNMLTVYNLIKEIKEKFPQKDIWLFTGLTLEYEDFTRPDNVSFESRILRNCDVIVDGPYIESQRDITLAFRGSTNQRIIDVQQTLKQNKVILYEG